MTAADLKGEPDYRVKPPLEMVPLSLMWATAQALAFGATKYQRLNWRLASSRAKYVSALLRHLFQWCWDGEPDKESGLSHLDHACACIAILTHMELHGLNDDRPCSTPAPTVSDDKPFAEAA